MAMADGIRNGTDDGTGTVSHGFLSHVGEARVDVAYWATPLPMRVYMRVMYAVCGALCSSMVLDGIGVADAVQWAVGAVVFAYVITFRWFRPNGFQNVYDDISEGTAQGLKELREGNYDGVPLLLVPDKDYDRVREERRQGRKSARSDAGAGNGRKGKEEGR